jgi:bis(5'-adenosyl)-triphosphatase
MSPSSQAIHFAQFVVTAQVFYSTKLCAAMVNLKPILPGHSLVIPRRVVPRYGDLSTEEVWTFI